MPCVHYNNYVALLAIMMPHLHTVNHGSLHIHSRSDTPQECEHSLSQAQCFFWP